MTDYFEASRRAWARFIFWAGVAIVAGLLWFTYHELKNLAMRIQPTQVQTEVTE